MTDLLRGLSRLAGPPEEEALVALGPVGPAEVPILAGVALGEGDYGPWARVAAVRLLGHARGPEAVEALLRLLQEPRNPEDRLSAEAMMALEHHGPTALPQIAAGAVSARPPGRELAVEVALRIASDFEVPGEQIEGLRLLLEHQFRHARHSGDRALYAGYLGDLGEPAAVSALLEGLDSPGLTREEYEAVREAVERLGEECPAYYFDSEGRGYPMDEEGILYCPICSEPLALDPESGRPAHRDGTPAAH